MILSVDYREKRTLVVFDGFAVFGGLPRNFQMVYVKKLENLVINIENCRNTFDFLQTPDVYHTGYLFSEEGKVSADHYRYFVLLPSCRAVAFRYRPKSLSPQGVVIEVENGKVRFMTTTY